nr:integrase, catalytic region, zinc finger, CCHC-type, peptidase aspartic, catalytic [Tanacetum cinerariifolium]
LFQRDTWSSQESAPTFTELFEINNLKAQAQAQAKDIVILKLKEKLNSLNGDIKDRDVKRNVEDMETLNIELDHKVTKLATENDHLKQTYKQLYDSIKSSRVRSKEQCDDLIKNSISRVNLVSSASGSMSQDNTKNNRIRQTQKKAKKNKVEDHLRIVKSSLNKASVVDSKATSSVLNSMSNVNSDLKCASSNGCLLSDNHDTCGSAYKNSVNARKKSKSVKTPVIRKIWKTTCKVFKTVGHI